MQVDFGSREDDRDAGRIGVGIVAGESDHASDQLHANHWHARDAWAPGLSSYARRGSSRRSLRKKWANYRVLKYK